MIKVLQEETFLAKLWLSSNLPQNIVTKKLYSRRKKPKQPCPEQMKSKKFWPKLEIGKKARLKFWTAMNRIFWKLITPNSANQILLSHKKTPMKLKNYYRKSVFCFLHQIFSDLSWYAIAKKNPSSPFSLKMFLRFGRNYVYPEEFRTKIIGDKNYKIRFSGTECFKGTFHVGTFGKQLAAKKEENWI